MNLQMRERGNGNREWSIAAVAPVAMPHSPFPIPRSLRQWSIAP